MNSYKLIISCYKESEKILRQLALHPHLWNQHRLRTLSSDSPHKDISDIWLRFTDMQRNPYTRYMKDETFCSKDMINYPSMHQLTEIRPLLAKLMFLTEGERLGRVIIDKLPPGKAIAPHTDEGETSRYYDRFHLILSGSCILYINDTQHKLTKGEIWWFNNQQLHSCINNTSEDCIHLIIDIKLHDYSSFWTFKKHGETL